MPAFSHMREVLEAAGLVPGLPVAEVRARLQRGLRLTDTGQRILAFYLNEMEVGRLHQATGHSSTAHYAQARLGLDRRRTSELVSVGKKLLMLPAIDHAFCTQEISWSKVLLLVAVAVPEHEEAWLGKAKELSCRDLGLEVRLAKPGSAPRAPGDRKGLPEIRFKLEATFGTLTQQKLDLAKKKLTAEFGRTVNDAEFLDVVADLVLQSEPDGSVPGRTRVDSSLYRIVLRPGGGGDGLVVDSDLGPLPVEGIAAIRCDGEVVQVGDGDSPEEGGTGGDLDPKTPPWLRRRILARDGHRCCSCGSRHRLMVHHIHLRSEGGPTQPRNLVTLCARCHGLVHDRLLVIVGDADDLRFRDREGNAIEEPDDRPERGVRDMTLAHPTSQIDSQAADQTCPDVRTNPVFATLETVPSEIDGPWWRRHAHLMRATLRGLEFAAGMPSQTPDPASEPPSEDRGGVASGESALDGLLGQEELVARLRIEARGSRILGKAFPHTLLAGPPGTGKSTIARGIAALIGGRFLAATGPLLPDVHRLVALLGELREGDVLFVDEAHAVPRPVLEVLYEAMTDRRLSLTLHDPPRSGLRARAVRLALPPFTLVAATSEQGDLPEPFLGRFGLLEHIDWYAKEVLATIVGRAAAGRGFGMEPGAPTRVAEVARGTPREALRVLDRILGEAADRGARRVDVAAVNACLATMGYDAQGLGPLERRYLAVLLQSLRPVSLGRLARMLGTPARTLFQDVEPFLFRLGLIDVGPRGRVAVRPDGSAASRRQAPGASARWSSVR